jgi:hypothetical protein
MVNGRTDKDQTIEILAADEIAHADREELVRPILGADPNVAEADPVRLR